MQTAGMSHHALLTVFLPFRVALHANCRNVVHRDLKLENLLLASPDEITKVHTLYCAAILCC